MSQDQPFKYIIENQRADKVLHRQEKLKEFIITKLLLYEMLKGLKKKKIKTVNNKMAKNIYQQLNLKNKLSKQEEQRQNHGYGEHFDGCQTGGAYWGMDEGVRILSTNR